MQGLVELGSKVVIASRKQDVIDEAKEKLEPFRNEGNVENIEFT